MQVKSTRDKVQYISLLGRKISRSCQKLQLVCWLTHYFSNFSVQIVSGGCTNDEFCGVESCEIVKALIPALPDATFRLAECQAACCKDSNCNGLDRDHDWKTRTEDTGTEMANIPVAKILPHYSSVFMG